MYDARFHAFQELSKLLDKVLPKGYQFTKEQSDAVHACARKLAKDLTGGEYEYSESKKEKVGESTVC